MRVFLEFIKNEHETKNLMQIFFFFFFSVLKYFLLHRTGDKMASDNVDDWIACNFSDDAQLMFYTFQFELSHHRPLRLCRLVCAMRFVRRQRLMMLNSAPSFQHRCNCVECIRVLFEFAELCEYLRGVNWAIPLWRRPYAIRMIYDINLNALCARFNPNYQKYTLKSSNNIICIVLYKWLINIKWKYFFYIIWMIVLGRSVAPLNERTSKMDPF